MSSDKNTANDAVNHPSHYTSGSIEVIDFLEDQGFGFHLANAVKYISRAGKKDPTKIVEDLRKAVWYINRYIGLLEKEEAEKANQMHQAKQAAGDASLTVDLASALVRSEKGGAL